MYMYIHLHRSNLTIMWLHLFEELDHRLRRKLLRKSLANNAKRLLRNCTPRIAVAFRELAQTLA